MKRAKNLIGIILIFFIVCGVFNNVHATTITFDQIVEKFNKSSLIDYYKNAGGSIKATKSDNSINVMVSMNGETENVEFLINDNILSIEMDIGEEITFLKVIITGQLIDVIGELHGYDEGELAETYNSEEIINYTIEEEGIEIEEISETKLKTKVDITKKIPLVDFSNKYIKVEDLEKDEDFKKYISGSGHASQTIENFYYSKSEDNGEVTLIIAQKKELTENAYKSLLSLIQVVFNSDKASNYFKSNYSGINIGDKEFKGFKIEINPTRTELEEQIIPQDKWEFVKVTTNRNLVNAIINGEETDKGNTKGNNITNDIKQDNSKKEEKTNTVKENDKTQSSGKLPQTGVNNITAIFMIIFTIAITVVFYKMYYNYKDIK